MWARMLPNQIHSLCFARHTCAAAPQTSAFCLQVWLSMGRCCRQTWWCWPWALGLTSHASGCQGCRCASQACAPTHSRRDAPCVHASGMLHASFLVLPKHALLGMCPRHRPIAYTTSCWPFHALSPYAPSERASGGVCSPLPPPPHCTHAAARAAATAADRCMAVALVVGHVAALCECVCLTV